MTIQCCMSNTVCCISRKGRFRNRLTRSSRAQARITAVGEDVTIVGISYMQVECLRAAKYLEDRWESRPR
jgi:pyruvate/2-oxoglutarate/acetoin dehydrogenase E1 component